MSNVYVLEPPTKGKVVVQTTVGPIDIELWPKEVPKAVRNFVQLCLEGYFDDTIFHRIIKGFLVQGGDPTGSGTGGESIYGGVFADELHSRLRFNHRGLVACADAGSPHSNGSQFFMTLDRCDWLDRKHTIFGKVTGDSIFNLLRLGEFETDEDDRPVYPPPKILSVEVLWNPFDDIVPRQLKEKPQTHAKVAAEDQEQKKKAVKKLNMLSFGDEVEEDELEAANINDKIKSIHDVLDDPRFLKEEAKPEPLSKAEMDKKNEARLAVRDALVSNKGNNIREPRMDDFSADDHSDNDDESNFDARMRMQILRKRKEMDDVINHDKIPADKPKRKHREASPSRSVAEVKNSKVEKLSMKKKGIGSEARADLMDKADADMELLNHAEQERQLLKQKRRRNQGREGDTLAKLDRFKKSISTSIKVSVPSSNGKEATEDDDSGWMATQLKFLSESSDKDSMTRKDDPNEYVVHDPLLEKGKEKFNRMQAKLKRREREWAGKSLT
ncbi:peptidyl-prolyl cis-trans isomerase CYP57-like [Zingiber officinale]|uniref:peptidyl-prolyl cis-trans isomerase CYP57-like n=1 Tax=Zingiber officinale TaxID=94328 RepID=UPI001C4C669B|nr:peptidyl-prolyl cis-trans isomerase CYP57-like [Zingiber officinale]